METNYLKPSLQKRQKRLDKRMDEEVIECYRSGSRSKHAKGYKKRTQANFPDLAGREGIMFRYGYDRRWLNDNLQPLIRYLRSNVGQHWDKVYSNLCRSLDKNSVTGQHVFDHLKDMVHTKVIKDGNRIITHDGWAPRELNHGRYWRKHEFYVHPKSGVLMLTKKKKNEHDKVIKG